jgi:hypothetical protein
MNLEGRVAAMTGGTQGLGFATVFDEIGTPVVLGGPAAY